MKKEPRLIIICGPSGSGKSTLLKLLFKEFPDTFGFSVSYTTRPPRPRENNDVDYHFVSNEEMQEAIEREEFIEHVTFVGNKYGTSKKNVQDILSQGKVCILDIEIEGVKQMKKTDLNPIYIFNNPPSIAELERRLRGRNTETEENLQERLKQAEKEIEYGLTPGNFDLIIHNTKINESYYQFRNFIVNELKKQQKDGVPVNMKRAPKEKKKTAEKETKN